MNLYSAIVAAIAIWAVVRITQHWLSARQRQADDGERAKIEALEARVRTLERIVTDRRESLERKFDDL